MRNHPRPQLSGPTTNNATASSAINWFRKLAEKRYRITSVASGPSNAFITSRRPNTKRMPPSHTSLVWLRDFAPAAGSCVVLSGSRFVIRRCTRQPTWPRQPLFCPLRFEPAPRLMPSRLSGARSSLWRSMRTREFEKFVIVNLVHFSTAKPRGTRLTNV